MHSCPFAELAARHTNVCVRCIVACLTLEELDAGVRGAVDAVGEPGICRAVLDERVAAAG